MYLKYNILTSNCLGIISFDPDINSQMISNNED